MDLNLFVEEVHIVSNSEEELMAAALRKVLAESSDGNSIGP